MAIFTHECADKYKISLTRRVEVADALPVRHHPHGGVPLLPEGEEAVNLCMMHEEHRIKCTRRYSAKGATHVTCKFTSAQVILTDPILQE